MFDFPASPAVGDVSNGYRFNGVGWAGGPIVATPQEQFFDLSGKATLDVDVPTWAKGVQIEGSVLPNNAANFAAIQVSVDGTTFLAGTSYQAGGAYHNSAASPYYGTQGAVASPCMYLSYTRTNLNMPHNFSAAMNLTQVGASLISLRTFTQAFDNTGGMWNQWYESYLNVASVGSIKKLRFMNYASGAFASPSWVKLKWLGGEVPQTNGIVPEAPMDGNEYVRVNGLWRLKKQQFDIASGATQLDIPVPTSWNPMMARLTWFIGHAGATGSGYGLIMRASLDGTTFPAGAADYYNAGVTGQGSPTGSVSMSVVTAYSYAWLDYGGENTSVGHQGVAEVGIQRLPNSVWEITARSTVYSNTAGVAYRAMMMANYLSGAFGSAPTNARLKAMRILLVGGQAMGDGRVIAEWL